MSICCRMPKATSCSTRALEADQDIGGDRVLERPYLAGAAHRGSDPQTQPIVVPATTCWPTRGRKQIVTPALSGQRQQQLRVDGLHVAAAPSQQRCSPRQVPEAPAPRAPESASERSRVSWRARSRCVDRIDLDRMHQVIGEVDHHAQAGEQQNDRSAHRQPRVDLGALTRLRRPP